MLTEAVPHSDAVAVAAAVGGDDDGLEFDVPADAAVEHVRQDPREPGRFGPQVGDTHRSTKKSPYRRQSA
jgi:hypothetical protein